MTELDRNAFGDGYKQSMGILADYNQRKADVSAGDAYSRGDVRGAANIYAKAGILNNARTLNNDADEAAATAKKAQQEQASHAVGAMLNMAQGLKQVPAEKRSEAFQKVIAPLLQQQGVDQAHIQQMAQSDFSDQTLDMTIAALGQEGKKYQLANGGDGYLGSFDPTSGTLSTLREAQPSYQPVTVEDGNGNKAVIPFDKRNPYGQQGAGGGQASQATAPQTGTRADRNNNPGNLKWDGRSRWQGMTGVDPQGFVIFDTPDNGVRAAGINLQTQASRGPQTLTSLITRYAPPTDNNDTQAYIASVAQQTGLDPNAQIDLNDPAIRQKVMNAMFAVEGGGTPARAPAPPQQVSGGPSGAIYASPGFGGARTPEWVTLTDDQKRQRGYDISSNVQENTKTGKVEVGSGANAQEKADRQGRTALRKDFDAQKDVQYYNIVATQYGAMKRAAAGRSATDDIALIFNYMKMLDPNSVVREGEFATAQQTGGLPSTIVNQYNQLVNGGRLNDSQRANYLKTASDLHKNARGRYDEIVHQYQGYAQSDGYDPNEVVPVRADPDKQPRPDGLKPAGKDMTPAQAATFKKTFKPGAQYGSVDAPFIVRDDTDYKNLTSGQHFIAPDGSVRTKP